MTECIGEIEDTRKDMYKVAKQMVRMKDTLINQRHHQNGATSSNYGTTSQIGKFGGTQVFKREDFINGADTVMRNTIGSPLKTNQGDLNPFSPGSPIDQHTHPNKKSHFIEPTNLDFGEPNKQTSHQVHTLTNKGP